MGRQRRQSTFAVSQEETGLHLGPSTFLPGRIPARYRPDPRGASRWRRIRKSVLLQEGYHCRLCGRPATEVDHRVELADGGAPFDLENLQALCPECHDAKSAESRFQRVRQSANSWGRLTLCPRCLGDGRCRVCEDPPHVCSFCLGIRFVPERCAESGEPPSQGLIAQVSPEAWDGAVPRPGETRLSLGDPPIEN